MIDLTLIPFGLRETDARFVDIYEVAKGRECGCICPSCKTPLIARQGNVNQWHFAHASRAVYEKTDNECDYSFFVSVRLMARQILGDSLELLIPPYKQHFVNAEARRVRVENVRVETEFKGVTVDVLGDLERLPFVIYFTYSGRLVPPELTNVGSQKYWAISISLERTYSLLFDDRPAGTTFQASLRKFLKEDVQSKRWAIHPFHSYFPSKHERSGRLQQEKPFTDFSRRPVITQQEEVKPTNQTVEKRDARFQCVMCRTEWIGKLPGHNACPKCKTHLFSTSLGYVNL